ncbi:MAG TPA: hypothetical protein VE397_18760 [Stellaceae bacterium]|jgi:hypothetical protein|nr:hypothetical protein [Stellaceae bacterium]
MSRKTEPKSDLGDIANLLISRYGERAYAHAMHQALKARRDGDRRLMEGWRWIALAVRDVLRTEPEDDAPERG